MSVIINTADGNRGGASSRSGI